MDNLTQPSAVILQCPSCFSHFTDDDAFCQNCGYPLKGTEQEQRNFESVIDARNIDLAAYKKMIKSASNSLYYVAGAFVLFGVIVFFTKQDDPQILAYVLPNIILAILFFALGGYSSKKPLACMISGLTLYIIVQVLNAIDNPATIVSGIIIKIAIIGYLIKGIKSALELQKFKAEHNFK